MVKGKKVFVHFPITLIFYFGTLWKDILASVILHEKKFTILQKGENPITNPILLNRRPMYKKAASSQEHCHPFILFFLWSNDVLVPGNPKSSNKMALNFFGTLQVLDLNWQNAVFFFRSSEAFNKMYEKLSHWVIIVIYLLW